jgi:hypothetical protein
MTNIDSVAPSLARLSSDIAPRPSRLGSTAATRTRQCHRQLDTSTSHRDQVALAAPLSAGLGIAVTSMTQGLGVCFPD